MAVAEGGRRPGEGGPERRTGGLRPPAGGAWVAAREAREQLGRVEALLRLEGGPGGAVVASLAPVPHAAATVPAHPLETDGRPENLTREPFHRVLFLRLDPNPRVNREASVALRQQQLGALLGQQPGVLEQPQHLVAEEQLRGMLVDAGHRNPLPVAGPAAAGHQRVHAWVPIGEVARRLHHRHHPRPQPVVVGRRLHELERRLPCRVREPAQEHVSRRRLRPRVPSPLERRRHDSHPPPKTAGGERRGVHRQAGSRERAGLPRPGESTVSTRRTSPATRPGHSSSRCPRPGRSRGTPSPGGSSPAWEQIWPAPPGSPCGETKRSSAREGRIGCAGCAKSRMNLGLRARRDRRSTERHRQTECYYFSLPWLARPSFSSLAATPRFARATAFTLFGPDRG